MSGLNGIRILIDCCGLLLGLYPMERFLERTLRIARFWPDGFLLLYEGLMFRYKMLGLLGRVGKSSLSIARLTFMIR